MGKELTVNTKAGQLAGLLEAKKDSIQAMLPKRMNADRLIKIALLAAVKNPRLLECTPESVYRCCIESAELGLEPGSSLGGAYLVPYKQTCTLIIGYQGMIDLARRSGAIMNIEARPIYANDQFAVAYGTDPHIQHTPADISQERGDLVGFYAVAWINGASHAQFEIMRRDEVDLIRARSWAKDDGPWVTDYVEMGRKTVVRRLFKYLPKSTEILKALEIEDAAEDGTLATTLDVAERITNPVTTTSRIRRIVTAQVNSTVQTKPADEGFTPERDRETISGGDAFDDTINDGDIAAVDGETGEIKWE